MGMLDMLMTVASTLGSFHGGERAAAQDDRSTTQQWPLMNREQPAFRSGLRKKHASISALHMTGGQIQLRVSTGPI